MAHLDGVFAKINRAEKHLNDFKAEFKRPPAPGEPFEGVIGNPQLKRQHVTSVAHVIKPPLEWSVWLGEIIHDIRSGLDHLVYELAAKHPDRLADYPNRPKRSATKLNRILHFPIYDDGKEFSDNWKVKDLKTLLDPDEFAQIERAQPYKRSQTDPRQDRLFILNELNNIDKHRTILMIDKRLQLSGKVGQQPFGKTTSVRETGAYLFRFPLSDPTGPDDEVNMDRMAAYILFDRTGVCDGEAVITTVRALIEDVSTTLSDSGWPELNDLTCTRARRSVRCTRDDRPRARAAATTGPVPRSVQCVFQSAAAA